MVCMHTCVCLAGSTSISVSLSIRWKYYSRTQTPMQAESFQLSATRPLWQSLAVLENLRGRQRPVCREERLCDQ